MRIAGTASNIARAYRSVLSNEYTSSSVQDAIEKPDSSEDVTKKSSSFCATG